MAEALRFTLPYPPSVNNLFVTTKAGKRVLGKRARSYRQAVAGAVLEQQVKRFSLSGWIMLAIRVVPPVLKRRRDIDNLSKAVLDALVYCGVISDDAEIESLLLYRTPALEAQPLGELHVDIRTMRKEGEVLCPVPSSESSRVSPPRPRVYRTRRATIR